MFKTLAIQRAGKRKNNAKASQLSEVFTVGLPTNTGKEGEIPPFQYRTCVEVYCISWHESNIPPVNKYWPSRYLWKTLA